jgi:hypothetical protein
VASAVEPSELQARAAFAQLDHATLVGLARASRRAALAAGDMVAEGEGSPPPILIEEGIAWVVRHGHRVGRLGPGDVADAAGVSDDASIVAATPMRVIVLPSAARDLSPLLSDWTRAR